MLYCIPSLAEMTSFHSRLRLDLFALISSLTVTPFIKPALVLVRTVGRTVAHAVGSAVACIVPRTVVRYRTVALPIVILFLQESLTNPRHL